MPAMKLNIVKLKKEEDCAVLHARSVSNNRYCENNREVKYTGGFQALVHHESTHKGVN